MILNCAIIDEDPEALALLKHYVEETPSLNLIGAYHNAIEAVDGIHHSHLDILFLAIHMQQISGLEFAKLVPNERKDYLHHCIQGICHRGIQGERLRLSGEAYYPRRLHGTCEKVFDSYMQDDMYNPIKRDKFLIVKSDFRYVRIPFEKHSLRRESEGLRDVSSGGWRMHHDAGQPETTGGETSEGKIQREFTVFHSQSNQLRHHPST